MPAKLTVVTSHPIQYQVPWFRALAAATDLEVLFCHRLDPAGQADGGFGVPFEWDVPLLDGYAHRWLHNRSRRPGVLQSGGCDTPDIDAVLRRRRIDACLVLGWYLKSYRQALRACRAAGVPVLMRGDSHLGTARPRIVSALKYLPYRVMLPTIDAHLYVGAANREYLRHYGVPESRLFFVPNFVDNAFFAPRASAARRDGGAAAVRLHHGIPAKATVFAWVGKLVANKRPIDLVHAMASARDAGSGAWALIVGSGPLRAEVEAAAARLDAPVRCAGFVNQNDLPRHLAACDALVLTSGSETWGLVVNEAMACGLPAIVSSAVGCAPDLVDHGRTGLVYPVGDIAKLAEAVLALERMLLLDGEMIERAVAEVIARYSCDAAVAGTLRALDATRSLSARVSSQWRPIRS